MGFRFRRSIRLGKGLRINISKSGTSLSVGHRGATVNFGPKGERVTLALPGTGISYSQTVHNPHHAAETAGEDPGNIPHAPTSLLVWVLIAAVVIVIMASGVVMGSQAHLTPSP